MLSRSSSIASKSPNLDRGRRSVNHAWFLAQVCWIAFWLVGFQAPAATQLPYATLTDSQIALPLELRAANQDRNLGRDLPGRRIPAVVPFAQLATASWTNNLVPLPEANTLAHVNFQQRRFGRLQISSDGIALFNPETILVKLRSQPRVAALRVEPMREWDAIQVLRSRREVQFAELDTFEQRQFSPNDPFLTNQWHHTVIGSPSAWSLGLGQSFIRIAIVDTPFQMDHPDLAANTAAGWDAVANAPINSSTGIVHSTMCAGMAAAVINNAVGVAGAANCETLPININGAISEMYNATLWAADHGVRVVNISWSGANSDTLESAGYYLKTNAGGILVMSAIDGSGFLNWTNQPDIYCISMTDAADNFQGTMYGPYIDFAAPGYQVFSTTVAGNYAYGTGTSYAAPLFSGVVAWLFGLNPTLGPDDVIGIIKNTATDLGPAGWDQFYGWGRINFAAAANAALATLPAITSLSISNSQAAVSCSCRPDPVYSLWRTDGLLPSTWLQVTNATIETNLDGLILTDPAAGPDGHFYRVKASVP